MYVEKTRAVLKTDLRIARRTGYRCGTGVLACADYATPINRSTQPRIRVAVLYEAWCDCAVYDMAYTSYRRCFPSPLDVGLATCYHIGAVFSTRVLDIVFTLAAGG